MRLSKLESFLEEEAILNNILKKRYSTENMGKEYALEMISSGSNFLGKKKKGHFLSR